MVVGAARPQIPREDAPVQIWGAAPALGAASFFRHDDHYLLRFHGIADFELAAGTARGTLSQLTDWTVWADKVLVF